MLRWRRSRPDLEVIALRRERGALAVAPAMRHGSASRIASASSTATWRNRCSVRTVRLRRREPTVRSERRCPAAPNPVGFEPRLALDGGMTASGCTAGSCARSLRCSPPAAPPFSRPPPATIERLAALATALPDAHVEIGEDYAGRTDGRDHALGAARDVANLNDPHMTKFVFFTGGVVSSLGKGITAASLGRLLKSRGLSVSVQKLDPYINVDAGR